MKVVEYSHYKEYSELPLVELLEDYEEDSNEDMFIRWYSENKSDFVELVFENHNDDLYEVYQSYKPKEENNKDYLIEKIIYDLVNKYIGNLDENEIKSRMDCETCYEYSMAKYEEYCESEFDRMRDEGRF